ncbi:MAG TPA: UbiA family prenyltransferase [Methanomassiliicoccales archaeon]|nr:UbiA family prenyltransferase [Methanomassiliicoccales archaeon]
MPEAPSFEKRLSEGVDRFVLWLEKDRFSLFFMFGSVLVLATIRDLLEYFLLDQPFVTTPHPWIYSIAHHVSFYAVVFLGLIFLLTAFSGRGFRKCTNFVFMFYWIIAFPPIIDHFIGGLNQNYAYFSITDFINAILHFSGEGFHIGQALEVVVILFAMFAYTIWTQRASLGTVMGRGKAGLRVFFLIFFTFASMFIIATPATFLPVGFVDGLPVFPAFDLTRYYQFHLFLVLYYLVAGSVLSLAVYYFAMKRSFKDVVRSMRPMQSVFFAAIVGAGLVTGWKESYSLDLVTNIFDSPYWVNLSFVGIAIIAALAAWQVGTIWNDLSDSASDERRPGRLIASGKVASGSLWQISLVLSAISVLLSFLLSLIQGVIILAILLLAYAYSFKPIRFKEKLLSPLLMGLGTFLAYLYGYLTPYSVVQKLTEGGIYMPFLTGDVPTPVLTSAGFLLGVFMFVGLVIGSMVMDLDGYEEDRRAGVRTIFTAWGREKGIRAVSVLVLLGSLTPLVLFHSYLDLVVFPVLGLASALMFSRSMSSRPVLLLAFVGLLYAALRYLALI